MAARAKRAAAKPSSNGGAANGNPPDPPTVVEVGEGAPDDAVAVDGVVVQLVRGDDAGFTIIGCAGVGDVRPAEVPVVLEKAVAFERKRLGLPAL